LPKKVRSRRTQNAATAITNAMTSTIHILFAVSATAIFGT
jgi:hypothetical protein